MNSPKNRLDRKVLILAFLAVTLFFMACAKGITPYEAANGKAKCGNYLK